MILNLNKEFLTANVRGFIEKEPTFNIADLIEAGDYFNGRIVLKDEIGVLYLEGFDADGNYYKCRIQDIKSIVTKEQMEKIAYKVGD